MSELEQTHGPREALTPKASPAVRWWAVLLGLLLVGLAFVAGREAWLVANGTPSGSWTQWFINTMDTPGVQPWMFYAAVGSIVVGLIFLFIAVKPRRTTHQRLSSDVASLWVRPVDEARIASSAARKVPGVRAAQTRAKGQKVDVTVHGDAGDTTLEGRVRENVNAALDGLDQRDVTVHVTPLQGGTNV